MNSIQLREQMYNGQKFFADSIRNLILFKDEQQLDRVTFDLDDIFLEPLLFAYFNLRDSKVTLDQILFGYCELNKRPSRFFAYVDHHGIIYLANFGYYKTNLSSKLIELTYSNGKLSSQACELFEYLPLRRLAEHQNIELVRFSNPLINEIFAQWPEVGERRIIEELFDFNPKIDLNEDYVCSALSTLKHNCPSDYNDFLECTKKIVLFSNPKLRSFVTRSIHGIVFLNLIDSKINETFFIEELIHQCSHNVFNAITADSSDYYKVPTETPLSTIIGEDNESRTLFSAFHGQYTVSKGLECILLCLNGSSSLSKEQLYELQGRLAIKKGRFRIGLERAELDKIFTANGISIYKYLDELGFRVLNDNVKLFDNLKFDNQGAVFSYSKFVERNGLLPSH